MADDNLESLQRLLAMKRQDLPTDAYFHGVLGEFHRRQRAELLVRKTRWERLMELWEDCLEFVRAETAPAWRMGLAGACGLALAIGVWQMSARDGGTGVAVEPAPAPAVEYAFNQGGNALPVSDEVLGLASSKPEPTQTHYVLSANVGTDALVAF